MILYFFLDFDSIQEDTHRKRTNNILNQHRQAQQHVHPKAAFSVVFEVMAILFSSQITLSTDYSDHQI